MKRVLLVNSLTAIGRAGLYPQTAVLSRAGVQACPVPSVVLSTHTGGFGAPTRADMTDTLRGTLEHFRALGLSFDMTVSGYFASAEQAELLRGFLAEGRGGIYICDPVMADGGKVYRGIGKELTEAVRRLAASADVVTPNVTETLLLSGRGAAETPDTNGLKDIAAELSRGRAAVVTGAEDGGDVVCLAAENGEVSEVRRAREKGSFPGTGDLFCGVLARSMLAGHGLRRAVRDAMEAAARAVRGTLEAGTDPRFGTEFEGTV